MMRIQSEQLIERSLEFEPIGGSLAWLGVAAALGLAALVWASRREALGGPRALLLYTLRAGVLLALVILSAQPTWREVLATTEPARLALAVDSSVSMGLEDQRIAEGTPIARIDGARQALGNLLDGIDEKVELALYRIDSDATALAPSSTARDPRAQIRSALDALQADGTHSRLSAGLAKLTRGGAGRLAGVLFFSDGRDAETGIARNLREIEHSGVPVLCVPLGASSAPDLELSALRGPELSFEGDAVSLQIAIAQRECGGRRVRVSLQRDGEEIESRELLLARALTRLELQDAAPPVGLHTYRAVVEGLAEESDVANNTRTLTVECLREPLRVLCLERTPRWEWRFLYKALERQERTRGAVWSWLASAAADVAQPVGSGIVRGAAQLLSAAPTSAAELSAYDCIILGDFGPGELPNGLEEALLEYVAEHAGALLHIAGRAHGLGPLGPGGALQRMAPAQASGVLRTPRNPFGVEPTALGAEHPLCVLGQDQAGADLTWDGLPGQRWLLPLEPHALATTLLRVDAAGGALAGEPVLCVRNYGRGLVCVLAMDGTWRWREIEGVHDRFWGNLIHWLGTPRLLARKRPEALRLSASVVTPGTEVQVEARLRPQRSLPADLRCRLIAASGAAPDTPLELHLTAVEGEAGLFRSRLVAPLGDWRLSVALPALDGEVQGMLECELHVRAEHGEERHTSVDMELLESIARSSGGGVVDAQGLAAMVAGLDLEPTEIRRERRVPAWAAGMHYLLIMLALAFEWTLRKRWMLR